MCELIAMSARRRHGGVPITSREAWRALAEGKVLGLREGRIVSPGDRP